MPLATRQSLTRAFEYVAKHRFSLVSRVCSDDLVFINAGYEEDPPMALPLEASDEPDRYFIQLYHRTAAQVDITGARVLEISCGHGGGASYLMRTLRPASYTGLDLNSAGIDFCRRRHRLDGLDFVVGNAVELPFPDGSFDAVINIQASFAYPSLPQFLAEVSRVLRPGGHFLYADRRWSDELDGWDRDLSEAPMTVVSQRVISEDVARGFELNVPRMTELSRLTPGFMVERSSRRVATNLRTHQMHYRMYCLANP